MEISPITSENGVHIMFFGKFWYIFMEKLGMLSDYFQEVLPTNIQHELWCKIRQVRHDILQRHFFRKFYTYFATWSDLIN